MPNACAFLGSTKDGSSIPEKLRSAYGCFRQFCKARKETPVVKHFTRDNLNWDSMRKYPEASFKGSDSRLMLAFLLNFLEGIAVPTDVEKDAFVAGKALDELLRLCYRERKEFMQRSEITTSISLMRVWSESFYKVAAACFNAKLNFFPVVPKFHYMLHVWHDLAEALKRSPANEDEFLNPALFSCQMAEDHVGRTCRISRSVHARNVPRRTAEKWLVQTWRLWTKTS